LVFEAPDQYNVRLPLLAISFFIHRRSSGASLCHRFELLSTESGILDCFGRKGLEFGAGGNANRRPGQKMCFAHPPGHSAADLAL
jgi:hypothetical protein